MKRLLALVLALAMVLGVVIFAGCDKNPSENTTDSSKSTETSSTKDSGTESTKGTETTDTTKGTETTDTTDGSETTETSDTTETTDTSDSGSEGGSILDTWDPYTKLTGYEDLSFGGATFYIAGYKDASDGYDTEREVYSEDTDTIADAANTRTLTVEKLYNCDVVFVGAETPSQYITAATTGGQPVHLVAWKHFCGGSWWSNGSYYNFYSLDMDMTQPWWNQNYVTNLTLETATGKKLYGVLGDFSLHTLSSTVGLMFNTELYDTAIKETLGYDIYQLVREGKWTMDIWAEMIAKAAYDADGNSEITAGSNDTVGWLNVTSIGNYMLNKASGLKILENVNGTWVNAMPANAAQWTTVIDTCIELLDQTYGVVDRGYIDALTDVASGKALFYSEVINNLENATLTDSDVKLSIVPFPKHFESQDGYSSFVETHMPTYHIPTSVANPDEVADFFTVWAAHSTGILRTAWVDAYAYEYLSGTQSAEMLDIVLDSRDFDPGYVMLRFQNEIQSTIDSGNNNITRMIERRATQWGNDLATMINDITNNKS